MITPKDIRKKAERKNRDFLRAVVQEETFFPLEIKGNKGNAKTPLAELFPAMSQLLEQSKERRGYGYVVELREVNTRHAGRMSMPQRIFFPTQSDFLQFLDRESEFENFWQLLKYTYDQFPQLAPFVKTRPWKLVDHLAVWPDLIRVARYFLFNPRPGLYLRELPIEVHTKFIEQHKSIIGEILDDLLPDDKIDWAESSFEKRYGLNYDEGVIRLRRPDPAAFSDLPDFAEDIALPVSQLAQAQPEAETVYIVENKQTFLAFPGRPLSLVIWGKGFAVDLLPRLPWLRDKAIYFWGDIDQQGFRMLQQLRQAFPQTRSLIMDYPTYEQFADFAHPSSTAVEGLDLSLLTDSERELYDFLTTTPNNRLEQEHISQGYLLECLGIAE